jgi:hypothetical protein
VASRFGNRRSDAGLAGRPRTSTPGHVHTWFDEPDGLRSPTRGACTSYLIRIDARARMDHMRAEFPAPNGVVGLVPLHISYKPTGVSVSRRSLQDDDPDGDVVADRRGRGERMKELVIAEGLWPGVGPGKAVKDSADVV